jgi:hypothetical protein
MGCRWIRAGRLMEKVGDVSAGAIGEHVVFVEEKRWNLRGLFGYWARDDCLLVVAWGYAARAELSERWQQPGRQSAVIRRAPSIYGPAKEE